jgi:lipopolysaccharide biosynthesis protein
MSSRIGVFCHMFHRAIFEEIRRYLLSIPHACDLHLSTCREDDAEALRSLFADWRGNVDIRVVENRGRDIAPKLITFAAAYAAYDYVLHVHTKGSMPEWRTFILDRLIGSQHQVERILAGFQNAPRLGMVGPEYFPPVIPWLNWGANRWAAAGLMKRMGRDVTFDVPDFPAGSMFWARPAALNPLLTLGITLDDFPQEPISRDGTIAHAVERLFFVACEVAGYQWKMVAKTPSAPLEQMPESYRNRVISRLMVISEARC